MSEVIIDQNRCKGCGLCVNACPKKVLELLHEQLNQKGYHPAAPVRPGDCIGCAVCGLFCPDAAITVIREEGGRG